MRLFFSLAVHAEYCLRVVLCSGCHVFAGFVLFKDTWHQELLSPARDGVSWAWLYVNTHTSVLTRIIFSNLKQTEYDHLPLALADKLPHFVLYRDDFWALPGLSGKHSEMLKSQNEDTFLSPKEGIQTAHLTTHIIVISLDFRQTSNGSWPVWLIAHLEVQSPAGSTCVLCAPCNRCHRAVMCLFSQD